MSSAVQAVICFVPRVSLPDSFCLMFVAVLKPDTVGNWSVMAKTLSYQPIALGTKLKGLFGSWICFINRPYIERHQKWFYSPTVV